MPHLSPRKGYACLSLTLTSSNDPDRECWGGH